MYTQISSCVSSTHVLKILFCFSATLAWTVGLFITMSAYLLGKSAKLSGYQTVKTNYPSYYQEKKKVLNTAKMFEGSTGTFFTPESAVNWNSDSSFRPSFLHSDSLWFWRLVRLVLSSFAFSKNVDLRPSRRKGSHSRYFCANSKTG